MASVTPIFNANRENTEIKNYRPVSILNSFSKIYEKFLSEQPTTPVNTYLNSNFKISIRKQSLYKSIPGGPIKTVWLYSTQCFIAKLHAYGLSLNTSFLNSYQKDWKQNRIIPGEPQWSVFTPIIFNILLNNFFLCLTKSGLRYFADDHTITTTCDHLADLLNTLATKPELKVNWFRQNEMIVNSDNFQAIVLNK